jgi:hypothetical protein
MRIIAEMIAKLIAKIGNDAMKIDCLTSHLKLDLFFW